MASQICLYIKMKINYRCYRNIIHIHNNVMWDWQYYVEYSTIDSFVLSNCNLIPC